MLREERIIIKRMVSQKICPSDGSGEREREPFTEDMIDTYPQRYTTASSKS
jgi:hypothetical protein